MLDLSGSLEAHEESIKKSSSQSLEQAFQPKVNLKRKDQEKKGGQFQQGRVPESQGRGRGKGHGRGRGFRL